MVLLSHSYTSMSLSLIKAHLGCYYVTVLLPEGGATSTRELTSIRRRIDRSSGSPNPDSRAVRGGHGLESYEKDGTSFSHLLTV